MKKRKSNPKQQEAAVLCSWAARNMWHDKMQRIVLTSFTSNCLEVKLLTYTQPGPLSGRNTRKKVTMNNPILRHIPTIGGVSHPLEVSPLSVN